MTHNVGILDRTLRIIIGVVLLGYAMKIGFPDTGWNWAGWIGVVPILTALVRVCPAYSILGIRT